MGDRFPDVLTSGVLVQYSPMVSGLEAAAVSVANMAGSPRETAGNSFGFGIGGNFPGQTGNSQGRLDTTATSANTGESGSQMPPVGFSTNVASSSSDINYDLRDINGDGMRDLVCGSGGNLLVRLNFGYRFAAVEENCGTSEVNNGSSDTISAGLGFKNGIYGFGGGVSASETRSDSFKSLADVNGDGLLDAVSISSENASVISVALNPGSEFEAPVSWSTGGQAFGKSNSRSLGASATGYFTISIPIFFWNIDRHQSGGGHQSKHEPP